MNFKDFLSSSLPTLSKSTVDNDLQMSLDEFLNHVEPVYHSFGVEFKNYKLKSENGRAFEQVFSNAFKGNYHTNFLIASFEKALINIPGKVDMVQRALEENTQSDILRASITARQINIVQLAEVISFVTRFSRRLLNFIVTCETNALLDKDELIDTRAAEVQYINDNFSPYIMGLNFLAVPQSDAIEMLEAVPDVLIDKAGAQTAQKVAGMSADPFNLGFIPVKMNFIYHIGMRIAEYQAARYHEAKYEQQALAAKILFLRKKLDGKEDAKLEQVIDNYETLLSKKTYEIAKMEENYG